MGREIGSLHITPQGQHKGNEMTHANNLYVLYRSTHSVGELMDKPTPWVCTEKMSYEKAGDTRAFFISLGMQAHTLDEHQFDNNIMPWH